MHGKSIHMTNSAWLNMSLSNMCKNMLIKWIKKPQHVWTRHQSSTELTPQKRCDVVGNTKHVYIRHRSTTDLTLQSKVLYICWKNAHEWIWLRSDTDPKPSQHVNSIEISVGNISMSEADSNAATAWLFKRKQFQHWFGNCWTAEFRNDGIASDVCKTCHCAPLGHAKVVIVFCILLMIWKSWKQQCWYFIRVVYQQEIKCKSNMPCGFAQSWNPEATARS